MSINLQINKENVLTLGAIFAALLIFSIPFSTAIAIILSILLFLCWLFSGQFLTLLPLSRNCRPVFFALALLSLLCLGLSYSNAPIKESLSGVSKYRELLLFVLLLSFFAQQKYRQWAINAFIIASIITLLGSYAKWLYFIPSSESIGYSFKSRITHSLMIAFFAFFAAHQTLQSNKYVYIWAGLFLLSVFNLFFIVDGRSGQFVFMGLMLLFGIQRFNRQGVLCTLLGLSVLLGCFFLFSQQAQRVWDGVSETQTYISTTPAKTETSMGLRLSFWKNSLILIAQKPLFGHGTGSYRYEYQKLVNSTDPDLLSGNPHNEYLMVSVQLGVLGLVLFLGFIGSQYQASFQLNPPDKWLLQGILLGFVLANCFNSSLLDHTEGHWFLSLMALYLSPLIIADNALRQPPLKKEENHGISKI